MTCGGLKINKSALSFPERSGTSSPTGPKAGKSKPGIWSGPDDSRAHVLRLRYTRPFSNAAAYFTKAIVKNKAWTCFESLKISEETFFESASALAILQTSWRYFIIFSNRRVLLTAYIRGDL